MLHTLSQNILTRLPTPHQYTSNTRWSKNNCHRPQQEGYLK
jgi:hypothetical protein